MAPVGDSMAVVEVVEVVPKKPRVISICQGLESQRFHVRCRLRIPPHERPIGCGVLNSTLKDARQPSNTVVGDWRLVNEPHSRSTRYLQRYKHELDDARVVATIKTNPPESPTMETLDPSTGRPLPPDAIQRILFIAPSVHIYNIPPLTSTKGYVASSWTADNNKRQIFTARLRILETAIPAFNNEETVKTDVLLEDPSNGQLFAAAPYTVPAVVEQVLDSSRFFALRVQGEGGRKAVLGIGFEERSEAFDFSVALQEVRKTLGIEDDGKAGGKRVEKKEKVVEKKDFSLKGREKRSRLILGEGLGGGIKRRVRSSIGTWRVSQYSLLQEVALWGRFSLLRRARRMSRLRRDLVKIWKSRRLDL